MLSWVGDMLKKIIINVASAIIIILFLVWLIKRFLVGVI